MHKMEKLYNPGHAGNLPPPCGGILGISNQADGTSTGYSANLTGIYANEETILAKLLDWARHAVGPFTRKQDIMTQFVLHMEDTKGISIITKDL